MSSNFNQIRPLKAELPALEHLKIDFNIVNTLAPSFLIGPSSFLQVTRTVMISRTSSKFGQFGPRTAKLNALEHLEKSP